MTDRSFATDPTHEENPMMSRTRVSPWTWMCLCWLAALVSSGALNGQEHAGLKAELHRIFEAEEYETEPFGPAKWLDGGASYTTLEPSQSVKDANDIIRYDTSGGDREVLVDATRLVPEGETEPLELDDYEWSADKKLLLVFANTKRVWRRNTRGDYWVLEVASGALKKLGADAEPSTLMFAKLSPDGTRAAYVRESNLYVEDIETGALTPLTSDGSETVINGTSDWVCEEELGVRDGFRWSPDGERIAFWRFDTSRVGRFALLNNTDTLYPEVTHIPYPKVGTTNSAVRIGVVGSGGGETRWMDVPGDDRDTYVARLEWAGDSDTLVLQHLNRLQNTNDILLADVRTGQVRRVHRDHSTTWVDLMDEFVWLGDSEELLWLSEKDGWRHAYRVRRDGTGDTLVTRFEADVMEIVGIDSSQTWLYFISSPENATQRHLYRTSLDGSEAPEGVAVGPARQPRLRRVPRWRVGLSHLLPVRHATPDRPRVTPRTRVRPGPRGQRKAGGEGEGGRHASRGVLSNRDRARGTARQLDDQAVAVRSQRGVPPARLRLRRAVGNDGSGPLGRRTHALSSSDRRRGLPGRQLRQPGHPGAQGCRLAQDDLRNRG